MRQKKVLNVIYNIVLVSGIPYNVITALSLKAMTVSYYEGFMEQ